MLNGRKLGESWEKAGRNDEYGNMGIKKQITLVHL
jgi:hypothetical protein